MHNITKADLLYHKDYGKSKINITQISILIFVKMCECTIDLEHMFAVHDCKHMPDMLGLIRVAVCRTGTDYVFVIILYFLLRFNIFTANVKTSMHSLWAM